MPGIPWQLLNHRVRCGIQEGCCRIQQKPANDGAYVVFGERLLCTCHVVCIVAEMLDFLPVPYNYVHRQKYDLSDPVQVPHLLVYIEAREVFK